MKIWIKYLIIGWSIMCIGIIVVSYQIMKFNFVNEEYEITMSYKVPAKIPSQESKANDWIIVAETLFPQGLVDQAFTTQKEVKEKLMKAKGVTIKSKNEVKDNLIYVFLPLYAFIIWAFPILIFSLIGILFGKK